MKYFLAIDIGASSGRHIVSWREDGELSIEAATRMSRRLFRYRSGSFLFRLL